MSFINSAPPPFLPPSLPRTNEEQIFGIFFRRYEFLLSLFLVAREKATSSFFGV